MVSFDAREVFASSLLSCPTINKDEDFLFHGQVEAPIAEPSRSSILGNIDTFTIKDVGRISGEDKGCWHDFAMCSCNWQDTHCLILVAVCRWSLSQFQMGFLTVLSDSNQAQCVFFWVISIRVHPLTSPTNQLIQMPIAILNNSTLLIIYPQIFLLCMDHWSPPTPHHLAHLSSKQNASADPVHLGCFWIYCIAKEWIPVDFALHG